MQYLWLSRASRTRKTQSSDARREADSFLEIQETKHVQQMKTSVSRELRERNKTQEKLIISSLREEEPLHLSIKVSITFEKEREFEEGVKER